MAVAADDSSGGGMTTLMIDETYEFSAPRFFDFIEGESEEDIREAELWFDTALSYAPSPFMSRIKTGRSFKIESLCDFNEADQMQKNAESSESMGINNSQSEAVPSNEIKEKEMTLNEERNTGLVDVGSIDKGTSSTEYEKCIEENLRTNTTARTETTVTREQSKTEACGTPKPLASAPKPKSVKSSQLKGVKPSSIKKVANVKSAAGTPNLAHENQAIKRQKLEGGKSRQILNVKPPQPLPHKSKLGFHCSSSSIANNTRKEERKVYAREPATATPFVSMAEMMKKFQSSTRDLSLPCLNHSLSHDAAASAIQRKPKLTLTRPKEPELETSQRVRSVRVKSTAELEEEMMAKIPKFKARPLNKKILETPTLPSLPRSKPQPPQFQEFHLETTARATQNAEMASVTSSEMTHQSNQWKPHLLTDPKTPVLHTSLRARPPRVKSSLELEKEELEKIPKFKARPLNKKIFESKGELGIFCNSKKQVTIPQEFHFATDERIPPPADVTDLFDKLSLYSEPHPGNPMPTNTIPNPFHLHTEERGAKKEQKLVMELVQKQLEEERARIPKANPYPYTTDYPVIPPKPEPKQCTKPEPFQLESLVRHEEELQREAEVRQRMEREEAQMRIFKAQPIIREDPIPVPEKMRKPLTQVEQFNLQADHRAVVREEFDQKVKEKEMLYKRYREESEAARMVEEEKALKQLRRTLVHHARPVPRFDHPFCPQKSFKEITKAKSPNLRVLRRKEMRKMVVNKAASSPASCMR